jgi:hypothetical protein
VSVDVHQITSLQFADSVPAGRYTFKVADPDPATGTAWVQLLRNKVPVEGVGKLYPTRLHLSPSAIPATVYTFDFPGYFKLGLAATPGPYRWVTLFNVYNTIFDRGALPRRATVAAWEIPDLRISPAIRAFPVVLSLFE